VQILIEYRREVAARLGVEERHDIFGHDVLILEALIEITKQLPPPCIIIDDIAECVEE
jgi:hypothetical protein